MAELEFIEMKEGTKFITFYDKTDDCCDIIVYTDGDIELDFANGCLLAKEQVQQFANKLLEIANA